MVDAPVPELLLGTWAEQVEVNASSAECDAPAGARGRVRSMSTSSPGQVHRDTYGVGALIGVLLTRRHLATDTWIYGRI